MTLSPILTHVAARWAVTPGTPAHGWAPNESETEMTGTPEWPTVGGGCECWENPNPYTYNGLREPGDAFEWNPQCPQHGEETTA